jgi:hypothetical protein
MPQVVDVQIAKPSFAPGVVPCSVVHRLHRLILHERLKVNMGEITFSMRKYQVFNLSRLGRIKIRIRRKKSEQT